MSSARVTGSPVALTVSRYATSVVTSTSTTTSSRYRPPPGTLAATAAPSGPWTPTAVAAGPGPATATAGTNPRNPTPIAPTANAPRKPPRRRPRLSLIPSTLSPSDPSAPVAEPSVVRPWIAPHYARRAHHAPAGPVRGRTRRPAARR